MTSSSRTSRLRHAKQKTLHGIARVTNRFRRDISIVKRRNNAWALSKHNLVDRHLLVGYYFEPERLQKCERYIKQYGINLFIDIGSNFGLYSIHLSRRTSLKHVYAFEPAKQNFNQLCANIFLNRLDRVVWPYNMALSDEDGTRTIYVDTCHTGMSRFDNWSSPGETKKTRGRKYYGETVAVRRLDSVLNFEGVPALAKIDVEGHEVPVLRGMATLLSANKYVLQIEIQSENEDAVQGLLTGMGYEQIDRLGSDWYFSNFQG